MEGKLLGDKIQFAIVFHHQHLMLLNILAAADFKLLVNMRDNDTGVLLEPYAISSTILEMELNYNMADVTIETECK